MCMHMSRRNSFYTHRHTHMQMYMHLYMYLYMHMYMCISSVLSTHTTHTIHTYSTHSTTSTYNTCGGCVALQKQSGGPLRPAPPPDSSGGREGCMVHKVGREPGRQVGKWVGGQLERVGRLRCLAGGCATGAAVEARAPINVLRRRAGGETGAPVRRGTPGGLYPFNINNSPRLRPGCPPPNCGRAIVF